VGLAWLKVEEPSEGSKRKQQKKGKKGKKRLPSKVLVKIHHKSDQGLFIIAEGLGL